MDPQLLTTFKTRLAQAREVHREAWERSSRLVAKSRFAETLRKLVAAIERAEIPPPVSEALRAALNQGRAGSIQELSSGRLKELTGLPPTKAMRGLCVLFDVDPESGRPRSATLSPADIEAFVQRSPNPYDLLLQADIASLLDVGAGDLSFAAELAKRYLPQFRHRGVPLVLHGLDRLRPGSQLGGRLQAAPEHLAFLKAQEAAVQFRFWGDVDMFALDSVPGLWPCYTIVTCHAPATPTFAYEPTRFDAELIEEDLRRTKGTFRFIRLEGEDALEVDDAGRTLIFPPWKFEIKGPLALVSLLASRGKLCVLSSIDSQVFWEIMSQLLAGEQFRPRNVLFTAKNRPLIFGNVFEALTALPVGQSMSLAQAAPLREGFSGTGTRPAFRFRYVEVRRGAMFPGIPASQTARWFPQMSQEDEPWMLVLVPDRFPDS